MMDSKSYLSATWRYILKIIVLEIAMIGVTALISFYAALDFATVLLGLGILIGGIGSLRGGPASIDSLYAKLILKRWHQPFNQALDQRTYIIENSVSTFSLENVMATAGLIAIILGLILIIS
jgi:hypothetical protein